MTSMPPFWLLMMQKLFGVDSERLATALWRHYPASSTLRWQLQLCHEASVVGLNVEQRIRRLGQLLEPAVLLRTSEKLTPPGRPKPKEIRNFQNRVLDIIDADGNWIWFKANSSIKRKYGTA